MNTLQDEHVSSKKIGQYLFMAILGLHVLSCYGLGIVALVNPQVAFETGFQIDYQAEFQVVGLIIGMELLFLGSIAVLGMVWTRKKQLHGIYVGTAVGVYMFLFGIVAFVLLGETDALVVDSIRGFLTLVFGYMAYKELKN
jgi:hypothetical protein